MKRIQWHIGSSFHGPLMDNGSGGGSDEPRDPNKPKDDNGDDDDDG